MGLKHLLVLDHAGWKVRSKLLAICTSIYREAGCNPMSTGILSDIFSEDKRGLVMSIFNWGIYGGYGIAFPVGRYVPLMNTWDLVSAGSTSLYVSTVVKICGRT
jgi:MFS family permease